MSELLIHPYLDEDVSVLIATLLRARGFAVTTTVEAGRRSATDADQLAFAVTQRMTILTHNRADFERLAADCWRNGIHHSGIIIAVRRSPFEIVRRLLLILDQVSSEEMVGQVRYI